MQKRQRKETAAFVTKLLKVGNNPIFRHLISEGDTEAKKDNNGKKQQNQWHKVLKQSC